MAENENFMAAAIKIIFFTMPFDYKCQWLVSNQQRLWSRQIMSLCICQVFDCFVGEESLG